MSIAEAAKPQVMDFAEEEFRMLLWSLPRCALDSALTLLEHAEAAGRTLTAQCLSALLAEAEQRQLAKLEDQGGRERSIELMGMCSHWASLKAHSHILSEATKRWPRSACILLLLLHLASALAPTAPPLFQGAPLHHDGRERLHDTVKMVGSQVVFSETRREKDPVNTRGRGADPA
ncbi:unnamed protein product [Durusdinium trenchii]|uniref:Uncharacterized protein n=1 Tax=Durusdinium trenchii TaxID=1381693 RepID=A0ABP0NZS3_9DINO